MWSDYSDDTGEFLNFNNRDRVGVNQDTVGVNGKRTEE